MTQLAWRRHLVGTVLLLLLVLVFFDATDLDIQLQDRLFLSGPNRWIIDAKEPIGRLFFYSGIKVLLVVFGIGLLLAYCMSFSFAGLRNYRRRTLLMVAALSLVPLVIAGLKNVTNVYFPSQLERYGGNKPYVKVFARYPQGYQQTRKGYGYPAGHASGGFSLMMLYFVFRSKRASLLGLGTGLVVGWAMGGYQMAKGAHFLSHTVITMLGAWLIILVIYRLIGDDPPPRIDWFPEQGAREALSSARS